MFEVIEIRVLALMAYAVFMTFLWFAQGFRGARKENKNFMRLYERDMQINKLINWQAEALKTLEGMLEHLEEANVYSRDLAKLNAELTATVMVFKSRFPHSYEIVMDEIGVDKVKKVEVVGRVTA